MPELPEVETMCRGIRAVESKVISRIVQPKIRCRPISITPSLTTIRRRLIGQAVESVTRLGKRVALSFADDTLFFQPKMTGLVSLGEVPGAEHLRLEITFEDAESPKLLFWDQRGLGTIQLLGKDEIYAKLIEGRLGPDAMAITLDDFSNRLKSTRRPVKVALLDQKLVAGVGNLYASEILHTARVSPLTACSSLTKKQLSQIYARMRSILQTAIDHEGSTLSDGTYRTALNDPGSYQNHHLVYDRENAICTGCGRETIKRIVQAQRSTFYCPRCQP